MLPYLISTICEVIRKERDLSEAKQFYQYYLASKFLPQI